MRRTVLALSLLLLTGCASAEKSPEPAPIVVPPVTTPTEQAPTEKAPIERAPTEQPPTEKAPAEQAPIEKAPTEEGPTVNQLTQVGTKVGEAAGVTLYHWVKAGAVDEYWAVRNDLAVRFPTAIRKVDQIKLFTTLLEGDPVFLLRGGDSPVHVANAMTYYVVRWQGGRPGLLLYTRSLERFPQALLAEVGALYSAGDPVVSGPTELKTRHGNPASGQTTINLTWQVDWDKGIAEVVELEELKVNPNK